MTTVGILGGGQLARMLALAGVPLGVSCVVVEPATDPPAAAVAEVIRAPYDDRTALAELARRCDVVTVELEAVPLEALEWLAERVAVHPRPAAVAATQDRAAEKRALEAAGIPTAPWADGRVGFESGTIVKARRGGYDGRGQVMVPPGAELSSPDHLGSDVISEACLVFERELSIVAARSLDGRVVCYPLVENRHLDGVLRRTFAPASGSSAVSQARAESMAVRLFERLGYVGVGAIELFEVDGWLVANEVAPRVHNSGHWTIEGAVTSQFEQHLRAITGLPLGSTAARGVSAMVNLLGGHADPAAVLAIEGAHLHDYGKVARPGRKVGHVTVVADTPDDLATRLATLDAVLAGSVVT